MSMRLAPPSEACTIPLRRSVADDDDGLGGIEPTYNPMLPLGRPITGYEVICELGRGGMGVVFQARDKKLHRLVAIKMMLTGEFTRDREAERFRAEADAIAAVQHPHIVQVYEVGQSSGRPYMAMEYVAGGTLARKAASRPQPIEASAEMVELLARALHAAHRQGVLHRDLKPSNVLLAPPAPGQELRSAPHALPWFGTPKVTDFGLAKQLDLASGASQSHTLMGTPSYMAPEQTVATAESAKRLGPATDVYGLGAILYELLTGRPPFDGAAAMDTVLQVREQEPIPPCYWRPRVPRDLQTICLKCLQKDPRQRYATAEQLAEDLRRFLDGIPILARPVSSIEKAIKWARRRPAVAGLVAACLLTAVAGLSGVLFHWRSAVVARQFADERSEEAVNNLARAEGAEAKAWAELNRAARSLYAAKINNSRLNWRANNAGGAALELQAVAPQLRGIEWRLLRQQQSAELWTFAFDQCVHRTCFSADGRHAFIAIGDPDGFLWAQPAKKPGAVVAWDLENDRAAWTNCDLAGSVRQLAIAPDGGRLLALSVDHSAVLIDTRTGQTTARLHASNGFANFHPTVARCVMPHGRDVVIYDSGSGVEIARWINCGECVFGANYSPDGRAVVMEVYGAGTQVRDASDGRLLDTWQVPGGSTVSPDGRWLTGRSGDNLVPLYRLPPGWSDPAAPRREKPVLVNRFAGHDGMVRSLAFSPDSRALASGGSDGTVRVWSLSDGQSGAVCRGHSSGISDVSWSRCGQFVVAGSEYSRNVKIWDMSRDPERARLGQIPNGLFNTEALAFADDGRRMFSISICGHLQCWDTATGTDRVIRELPVLRDWSTPAKRADFDTSARHVAAVCNDLTSIALFDTERGQERLRLSGHTKPVNALRFSPDGRWLVSSAFSRRDDPDVVSEVKVWDLATGLPKYQWDDLPAELFCFAFRPDGEVLIAGGRRRRQTATMVNHPMVLCWRVGTATWEETAGEWPADAELPRGAGPVIAAEFDATGRQLALGRFGDAGLAIWEFGHSAAGSRCRLQMTTPSSPFAVRFTPDGERLIGASRDGLRIWDTVTGQEILMLRGSMQATGDPGVNCQLALAPDGSGIAASNWDGSISFWPSEEDLDQTRRANRLAARRRSVGYFVEQAEGAAREGSRGTASAHLRTVRSQNMTARQTDVAFGVAVRAQDWESAAHLWRNLREQVVPNRQDHVTAAYVLSKVGRPGEYADHIRSFLDGDCLTLDPNASAEVLIATSLRPDVSADDAARQRLVDVIAPLADHQINFALALGLVHYRQGRCDDACRALAPALEGLPNGCDECGWRARVAAVLAACHARAGRWMEARAALERSRELTRQFEAEAISPMWWQHRLAIQLHTAEAEAALALAKK